MSTDTFSRIKESVAIVTASTDGIGKAVAVSLLQQGLNVVINSRCQEHVEKTVQELSKIKFDCNHWIEGVVADLSEGACDDIFAVINKRGAPLKAAFVNTPTPAVGYPESLDEGEWDHAVRSLVRFPDEIIRRAAEEMARTGGGAIVVNASCSATTPIGPEFYLANTLRSVSVAQAKAYARRYIRQGVRINVLLTGYVDTALTRNACQDLAARDQQNAEELWAKWESSIPVGRVAKPDEIARVASFLLSSESSYVVGAALEVDGGISMLHKNF
jgi:3-oxoacyl-[acyl-carrier protein] reductase